MNKLTNRQYLVIRLILWSVAVAIATIPTWRATESFRDLVDGEKFKDLLFVVVPVSALALSTTLDYLCVGFPDLSAKAFFNCVCSMVLNVTGLVTGLSGFLSIHGGAMSTSALWTYSCLMVVAVTASLVSEIVIALWHHSFRPAGSQAAEPPRLATVGN